MRVPLGRREATDSAVVCRSRTTSAAVLAVREIAREISGVAMNSTCPSSESSGQWLCPSPKPNESPLATVMWPGFGGRSRGPA